MSQTIVFADAWLQDQSLTWPARCLLGLLYKLTDGGKHPFYSKNANSYISRIMCFTANELRTSWKSLVKSQYIIKNISQQAGNATEVTLLPKAYEDETLRNPHEGLLNSHEVLRNSHEVLRNSREGTVKSTRGIANFTKGSSEIHARGIVKSTRGYSEIHARGLVKSTRHNLIDNLIKTNKEKVKKEKDENSSDALPPVETQEVIPAKTDLTIAEIQELPEKIAIQRLSQLFNAFVLSHPEKSQDFENFDAYEEAERFYWYWTELNWTRKGTKSQIKRLKAAVGSWCLNSIRYGLKGKRKLNSPEDFYKNAQAVASRSGMLSHEQESAFNTFFPSIEKSPSGISSEGAKTQK